MKRQTILSYTLISLLAITGAACDGGGDGGGATGDATSSAGAGAGSDAGANGAGTQASGDALASAPATPDATEAAGPAAEEAPAWGAACTSDEDCGAPTDYCVVQPGAEEGYCTIRCPEGGADCTFDDWTCNIIGTCDAPAATWCGPPEEIDNSGGFLIACP